MSTGDADGLAESAESPAGAASTADEQPMPPLASGEVELTEEDQTTPHEDAGGGSCQYEGKAVPVLVPDSTDGGFTFNREAVEEILLQDGVQDKPVVVLSVAGAFRQGKSFLLNLLLRYLSSDSAETWLQEAPNLPLKGFPWRSGFKRHTCGILMWSQPVIRTLVSGQQVAVILLDTQGTFDDVSTVRESATVFALSTMISSIEVYNVMNNLRADQLQHLQMFIEYGRLAVGATGETPFQRLLFLVRDWSNPHELPYGFDGGRQLLENWKVSAVSELKSTLDHIHKCFAQTECFLLPHPGLQAAQSSTFDGRLSALNTDFVESLEQLAPSLLCADRLTMKQIGGNPVLARELVSYISAYVTTFNGDQLPTPRSILDATAEANNLAAVQTAELLYRDIVKPLFVDDTLYLEQHEVQQRHNDAVWQAVDAFTGMKKMGGRDMEEKYRRILKEELKGGFDTLVAYNKAKRDVAWAKAAVANEMLVQQAREMYKCGMRSDISDGSPALSPGDMEQKHRNQRDNAVAFFDTYMQDVGDSPKKCLLALLETIDNEYSRVVLENRAREETNNAAAVAQLVGVYEKARSMYAKGMSSAGNISPLHLKDLHGRCCAATLELFAAEAAGPPALVDKFYKCLVQDMKRELDHSLSLNAAHHHMYHLSSALCRMKNGIKRNAEKACNVA